MNDTIVIQQEKATIVIEDEANYTEVSEVGIEVISLLQQGPAGPPGPVSGYLAGSNLSGHRAVIVDENSKVVYADNQTPSHTSKVLGITLGAAVIDDTVSVRTFGEVQEPSWNWTLDQPIYLGANGVLTQALPITGFLLVLAFPISPTKIFISIKQPYVRS